MKRYFMPGDNGLYHEVKIDADNLMVNWEEDENGDFYAVTDDDFRF